MDPIRVKQLRRNLTLHFAVIAWLTAMLVAAGSGSAFLPVLIFFVSLGGFIFVDSLEWFELGRIGSYLAMTFVTSVAVASYLYSVFISESETGQLVAVAGLLVYPECVLFLQRKSQRVYEQLAIFLLLEMVVAALINDNLFFGILLTPIMLLWVSSLFLFSRYATLVRIDPSIDQPLPLLVELIYQRFVKSMLGDTPKAPVVSSQFIASQDVQASSLWRRGLQTLPIGVGALAFAAIFFYLLPRTSPGAFRAGLGVQPRVGIPSELRMGSFGRLLQDTTPVMRVSFRKLNSNVQYGMAEPPYLRAKVFDVYGRSRLNGFRGGPNAWGTAGGQPFHPDLGQVETVDAYADNGADLVVAEIDIRREFATTLVSIPPAFKTNVPQRFPLRYDRFNLLLESISPSNSAIGKSLVYEIGSAGFARGRQLPIMPATLPRRIREEVMGELAIPIGDFRLADAYRLQILREADCDERDRYQCAKVYESRFLFSGEFGYTLDLRPPQDPNLDPIEDFIINQRQGHCQYFASAMVALLRQQGIPSRIVVGYRPTEFNSFGYFRVRQADAHAWVEAMFSRDELQGTELEPWLTPGGGHYWVRFDPTPASEGRDLNIREQPGQAIDFAEKLWKDYVVDAQKISGENSLYAPMSGSGENAYENLMANLEALRTRIESGGLFNGTQGIHFAWPIAFFVIAVGSLAVGAWRLSVWLPRWAPNLASRLGLTRTELAQVKEPFYARCLHLLSQSGLKRSASQTPFEFTSSAASLLSQHASTPASAKTPQALNLLTGLYYRLRFGTSSSLTEDEQRLVAAALNEIETTTKSLKATRR